MKNKALKRENICCLIISFNPDEGLKSLVGNIKHQVDKIIIVDNNSSEYGRRIIDDFDHEYIHVVRNERNFGIARALNQGFNEAKKMNYDWVITFDQDSSPLENFVEVLTEAYKLYPRKEVIGAIGANYLRPGKGNSIQLANDKGFVEKDYLITSGSLVSTEAFCDIGGFREDFFIDNVDLDFSLRLKRRGWISLSTNKVGMLHMAGFPEIKKILGIKVISSNHSIFRRYYMARNHVLLSREHFVQFPYFVLKLNYFFFLSLIKILIVEKSKTEKIRRSFKGVRDGIFYSSQNKIYNEK